MAFDKKLLNIIACPVCKGELVLVAAPSGDGQELVCRFDRLAFPIKQDIPVLLEQQARKLSLDELENVK